MSALSVEPEEFQQQPIVGWRVWRVVEVDTLAGRKEVRLAAAGTRGLPPLWPPLEPMVAVCSEFDSRHEAPWPDHECGVYALRTRRLMEERLAAFVGMSNGDGAEAWATGRISLWGRVVECERGWRGQYAYPYELTVLSEDATLARRLSSVYAVDVAVEPPRPQVAARTRGRLALDPAKLAEIEERLEAVKEGLGRLAEAEARLGQLAAAVADDEEEEQSKGPIPFEPPITDEELLLALVANAAFDYGGSEGGWGSDKHTAHAPLFGHSGYLCEAVLYARGLRIPRPHSRPGYELVNSALKAVLERFVEQGLLELGRWPGGSDRLPGCYWLTRAGIARVAATDVPPRLLARVWSADHVVYVDTTVGLRAIRKRRCLFDEEVEASQGRWLAERLAAKQKGKAEYRRFIEKRRREDERLRWSRLRIPDDEVREAVEHAVAAEEHVSVRSAAIADQLLPGRRTETEAARLNAALRRLYEAGLISKHGRGQWGAAEAVPGAAGNTLKV